MAVMFNDSDTDKLNIDDNLHVFLNFIMVNGRQWEPQDCNHLLHRRALKKLCFKKLNKCLKLS